MRTLIKNACVLTANPAGDVFEDGFVLLGADRRIEAVGPAALAPPADGLRVVDAQGAFVAPGMINLHQHLHMNLLKGLADGMLLEPWVFNFSAHSRKFMQREDVNTSLTLGAMEMLRTGTTCVLNHQSSFAWPDLHRDAARLIAGVGLRQVLAVAFQCRTPKLPQHPWSAEEAVVHTGALTRELQGAHGGMTRAALVVECNAHHTEAGRSSDELVRAGHALAREQDLRIAVHMSGGTLSMKMGFTKYRRQTGRSDVEYLDRLGVLDHRWLLKHGIHFSDDDIRAVARTRASVVYTPTSEAIRGGGLGHWRAMREAGVNCTLGTDGPAVDYSVDMVEQMKACCYLQSVRYGDPQAVQPRHALEMATLNAARALGLDDEIGSLEPGKRADLVLFERDRAHLRLVRDPVAAFVRAARGADARLVMVDGRVAYQDGLFPLLGDAGTVIERAQERARALSVAADLGRLATAHWPGASAAA